MDPRVEDYLKQRRAESCPPQPIEKALQHSRARRSLAMAWVPAATALVLLLFGSYWFQPRPDLEPTDAQAVARDTHQAMITIGEALLHASHKSANIIVRESLESLGNNNP